MQFLAISGSGRRASTNTAMLRAVSDIAHPAHDVEVFSGVADLPVFSPDKEDTPLPVQVQRFVDLVQACDGLIVASPEYVRSIPGGVKNAIDWLVSRDELIGKPIVLMHASHRGEDMLTQLRLVMGTVSERFNENLFLRFSLIGCTPDEISARLYEDLNREAVMAFLQQFAQFAEGEPIPALA